MKDINIEIYDGIFRKFTVKAETPKAVLIKSTWVAKKVLRKVGGSYSTPLWWQRKFGIGLNFREREESGF